MTRSENATEKADTVAFSQITEVIVSGTFTQTITQDCQVEKQEIDRSYCETLTKAVFGTEEPLKRELRLS